jgi:hypothetical protein
VRGRVKREKKRREVGWYIKRLESIEMYRDWSLFMYIVLCIPTKLKLNPPRRSEQKEDKRASNSVFR